MEATQWREREPLLHARQWPGAAKVRRVLLPVRLNQPHPPTRYKTSPPAKRAGRCHTLLDSETVYHEGPPWCWRYMAFEPGGWPHIACSQGSLPLGPGWLAGWLAGWSLDERSLPLGPLTPTPSVVAFGHGPKLGGWRTIPPAL